MTTSQTQRIDAANILLLLVSMVIAYKIPFKLFLLSYGILGPLHYLTEIHWLKENKYFLTSDVKKRVGFITIAILIPGITLSQIYSSKLNDLLNGGYSYFLSFDILILTALFLATGVIFIKRPIDILSTALACYAASLSLMLLLPKILVLVGLFLPTLIHVYLFTLLFMIYGAKKGNSTLGYSACILLVLAPFFIFLLPIDISDYTLPIEIEKALLQIRMTEINSIISSTLTSLPQSDFKNLSEIGIRIQIFIGFSYTYHYLNWFSKTSIIGWKESMTTSRKWWILIIWIMAISIYIYDFTTGFYALFYLSTLHVIMEFPLNIKTLKSLGRIRDE